MQGVNLAGTCKTVTMLKNNQSKCWKAPSTHPIQLSLDHRERYYTITFRLFDESSSSLRFILLIVYLNPNGFRLYN